MKKQEKTNYLKWFKTGNKYGAHWTKTSEVAIPAEYGCPPYFSREGYAMVWKD